MEDFYMNITSQDNSYDYSNITSNYSNITYDYNDSSNVSSSSSNNDYVEPFGYEFTRFVAPCIVPGIGLPLTLVAIYALYSQIRKDDVAPIYVINLLISDLIQLCCLIVWVVPTKYQRGEGIFIFIHVYCLMVSILFMVCIALERYLVIVHPLWYRFRRTIKISVGVCVLVWVFPFVYVLTLFFWVDPGIIFGIFFLLPLPLFIFFLGGTLKALFATRVPSDEKRRIVGILVVVLLIYLLLFLPATIWFLSLGDLHDMTLLSLSLIFVQFSPLADLILYIFMRKGTIDKLLSSVCCCRMDSDDTNSSVQFSSA